MADAAAVSSKKSMAPRRTGCTDRYRLLRTEARSLSAVYVWAWSQTGERRCGAGPVSGVRCQHSTGISAVGCTLVTAAAKTFLSADTVSTSRTNRSSTREHDMMSRSVAVRDSTSCEAHPQHHAHAHTHRGFSVPCHHDGRGPFRAGPLIRHTVRDLAATALIAHATTYPSHCSRRRGVGTGWAGGLAAWCRSLAGGGGKDVRQLRHVNPRARLDVLQAQICGRPDVDRLGGAGILRMAQNLLSKVH